MANVRTWPVATVSDREAVLLGGHYQLTGATTATIEATSQSGNFGIKKVEWIKADKVVRVTFQDKWQKVLFADCKMSTNIAPDDENGERPTVLFYRREVLGSDVVDGNYIEFWVTNVDDGAQTTDTSLGTSVYDLYVHIMASRTSARVVGLS